MDGYIRDRTCVYHTQYRIVWCVKYRRQVLSPEISKRLYEIVEMIAQDKGFEIINCRVHDSDRVECHVSGPPKMSITQIVKYLKGISGIIVLKEFPDLKRNLWKGQLWNGSYFCETIGNSSPEETKKYVDKQKTCQL